MQPQAKECLWPPEAGEAQDSPLEPPEEVQTTLDFRLLASRTGREQISAVLSEIYALRRSVGYDFSRRVHFLCKPRFFGGGLHNCGGAVLQKAGTAACCTDILGGGVYR